MKSPLPFPGHTAQNSAAVADARLQAVRASLGPFARHLGSAAQMPEPSAPHMLPSGIPTLDQLTGGVPRGALTEFCGPASSGRTTLLLSLLSALTRAGEVCALADASDSFDPHSAAAAGVDLRQLLWVRCNGRLAGFSGNGLGSHDFLERLETHSRKLYPQDARQTLRWPDGRVFAGNAAQNSGPSRYSRLRAERGENFRRLEQALRVADLLLQAGGFALVALDFGNLPAEIVGRVPLASWFRFRRAVEHTPTALLLLEPQPSAKTCASLVLEVRASVLRKMKQDGAPTHSRLLGGLEIDVEIARSRLEGWPRSAVPGKKPPQPAQATVSAAAQWNTPA